MPSYSQRFGDRLREAARVIFGSLLIATILFVLPFLAVWYIVTIGF